MKNNTEDKKKDLRKKQLILRKNLSSSITKVFVQELFEKLFEKINFNDLNIISSFNSINTEINTIELNEYIIKNNKILCFPVITNKNDHLVFRKFTNYNDMTEGFMKINEPSKRNPTLFPQLLFVPCLAYDKDGYRLGYGGGYYDKTFAYLKKNNRKFISAGYAFDDQVVLNVPKDKFDIKLDYVITEKDIYSFL